MAFVRHGDTVRGHAPERAFRRNPATRRDARCPGTSITAYSGMGYEAGCLPVDALGTGCGIPEPDIPGAENALQALFQAHSGILCPGTGSPTFAPSPSSDKLKPGRRAYTASPAALLARARLFRPASSLDINSRKKGAVPSNHHDSRTFLFHFETCSFESPLEHALCPAGNFKINRSAAHAFHARLGSHATSCAEKEDFFR